MAAILPISEVSENEDIVMLTSSGQIKRCSLARFAKINAAGVTAMGLREDDSLKFVSLCSESDSVLLTSSVGLTLHFPIDILRQMGRTSIGVKV